MTVSRDFKNELAVPQRNIKMLPGTITTDGNGDVSTKTGSWFSAARSGTGEYTITFLDSYGVILYANAIASTGRWVLTSSSATTAVFTRFGGGTDVQSSATITCTQGSAVATTDILTIAGVAHASVADEAAATGTLTCTQASAVAATDEVTIDGVSYASVASDPDVAAGEWLLGASDSDMATNLAAAINGHSAGATVTAVANAADVELTWDTTGVAGNVNMSETGNGIALSGATMTGGVDAPDVTAGEWEIGADNDGMATNLAAAINGHTSGAAVAATVVDNVVTVTADAYGGAGNLAISEAGNGMALSGSALSGGYNDPEAAANLTSGTMRFVLIVDRG